MIPDDSANQTHTVPQADPTLAEQTVVDVAPPVGVTPPQVLAQEAADGRRGAAWRLLYWIMENDPRAVIAVSSLEDDRLARHLVEFIASGTWAGKPFVIPRPLRSAHARTKLRTLFLPGSGMQQVRAERVLLAAMNDGRASMRETAAHILGICGSHAATPRLIEALRDPVASVRLQAVKALGRVGDPSAVPALLNALHNDDEQMASQIFIALVQLRQAAVPALLEACKSSSAWMRWHCIRALGAIGDMRVLPVLVRSLCDPDHSVAWVGAKELTRFGKPGVIAALNLISSAEMTPWIVETASYVLYNQCRSDAKFKPYLEPVIAAMHGVAYQIAGPQSARKALAKMLEDGVVKG
jgi:HEAT repeat protein